MNTALRHKVRVFKGLLLVLLSVLLTVLGAMLFEVYASVRGVDISTLLFYLSIGTEELTNYSVVSTTIEAGLKLAFFALLLLSWLWLSYGLQHTSIELCIFFFRFHWKLRIFSLFRLKKALLLLFPAAWILIDLVLIFFAIGMPQYLSILGKESTIYDNFYTDPATQNIQLPETKRNIIHIVLESMETTYEDYASGGCWEYNLIPNLTALAENNISFSNMECLTGASYTSGALVAQNSGITGSYISSGGAVVPGATTLGDILKAEGYQTIFMCGSDAEFGERSSYYAGHSDAIIWDYYTAVSQGKIPITYKKPNCWGIEDEKLYEYAKEVLTEQLDPSEPFYMTLLTVDTHCFDGWLCDICPDDYPTQYENVIACADNLVDSFLIWLQEQDFYENTTVVITGDHLSMDHDFFLEHGVSLPERLIYNCILNPDPSVPTVDPERTFTALDIFPTMLGAIGAKWDSDSLGLGVNLFSSTPTLIETLGYMTLDEQLKMESSTYQNLFFSS